MAALADIVPSIVNPEGIFGQTFKGPCRLSRHRAYRASNVFVYRFHILLWHPSERIFSNTRNSADQSAVSVRVYEIYRRTDGLALGACV